MQYQNSWISYAISGTIIALVLGIRIWRMNKVRPLRIERLWIVPAILALATASMFIAAPPSPLGWALSLVALVIGAALGWQRGRFMRIQIDPETHMLNQRSSPAALLFIVGLIAVRFAARSALASGAGDTFLHLNAMTLTDILVALALGLVAATRLEMYLRARRMLESARAARA
ncbi:cytochrome c biogenesis protein CcdC [Sphingomonas sp. IC-56]|uniref:CcdC protein domain-containing protein n=1 Tax=Sphingomonas sp. IC-56 TaxID=2898529 RepID=UPI001E31018B|nr:CcdC protein domain-containing protein [Sphingomonas sp. IC-56]MCD2324654.1 cytochrome c biogenesis protein CcdC [Sphingomonas sp. IC-56]